MVINNNNAKSQIMPTACAECPRAKSCDGVSSCTGLRKDAVSLFIDQSIWTANELKHELQEKLGLAAIRGSLKFLAAGKCPWITAWNCIESDKPVRFKRHGRVFALTAVSEIAVSEKLKTLLTKLQKKVLNSLEYYDRKPHYLSLYDLRRILPHPGNEVEFAASRLHDFGLAKSIKTDGTTYYCLPGRLNWMKDHLQEAIAKDKAEYQVVSTLAGLFRSLYPRGVLVKTKGVIRASKRDPEVLKSTGGMTFDIVYEFKAPIMGRRFIVVDVHSRIPVTEYVVNSFMNKILWARRGATPLNAPKEDAEEKNYPLRNKTFGMIVFRRATQEAITIANANNLSFIRIKELGINYAKLFEQIVTQRNAKRQQT
jgi:hypothetical protein